MYHFKLILHLKRDQFVFLTENGASAGTDAHQCQQKTSNYERLVYFEQHYRFNSNATARLVRMEGLVARPSYNKPEVGQNNLGPDLIHPLKKLIKPSRHLAREVGIIPTPVPRYKNSTQFSICDVNANSSTKQWIQAPRKPYWGRRQIRDLEFAMMLYDLLPIPRPAWALLPVVTL